jgi:hypothetical protein
MLHKATTQKSPLQSESTLGYFYVCVVCTHMNEGVNTMAVIELDTTVWADGRMTPEQTALYLGVKPKTLGYWRWVGSGPPFIKAGRIYYFKRDIDQWLMQGGLVTSTAQARRQRPPVARRKRAEAALPPGGTTTKEANQG